MNSSKDDEEKSQEFIKINSQRFDAKIQFQNMWVLYLMFTITMYLYDLQIVLGSH